MRLTAKELEQMKSVDIGAVAPESLPDVSGMAFDTSLPREERIALFLQAVDNPYCFCIGGAPWKAGCMRPAANGGRYKRARNSD